MLAVGLRPCSGALIVLSFAMLNGLYLGGVLSVFAMAVGTAITVSVLATLAVTAKDLAVRYASSAGTAMRVTHGIEIFGALLVLVLGARAARRLASGLINPDAGADSAPAARRSRRTRE